MPSTPAAFVSITVSPQYLRTLDQFDNRQELLYALSDAIAQHGEKWTTSGIVHGNINLNTIRIGNMHGPPGTRGILVNNHQSPSATPVAFQSVMSIVEAIPGRMSRTVALDYVDDLESFYYVLAYICTTFSGPHTKLATSTIPSPIKCIWSISEDGSLSSRIYKASFLEKETNLKFFRYGVGRGRVTPYFSSRDIIESLLEDLHCVLRYRYLRKVGGGGIDARPEGLASEELQALLRQEANDDYFSFKAFIEYAIDHLDVNDGHSPKTPRPLIPSPPCLICTS
ncbi:hypothetical protein BYT27DRAFT_7211731 [Phlegmacium glaucopus]|nr:hypothetical protein BYT27DRAFT_7211731 [Phlegmacium glaucopus]